jgi:RHS repeat-associated protein
VLVAVVNGDGNSIATALLKGIISSGSLPFYTAAGGSYVLTVRTVDTFGNASVSAPVTVTIAATPNEEITFLHEDLAGNTIAATDAKGAVLWKENYSPFGERMVSSAAASPNRQWFAGKPQDRESGLSYFGARYYDPAIGRFMGIDPVGFQDGNVHSFNRYAYGNNNPYKYRDPDGRFADKIILIGVVAGGLYIGSGIIANNPRLKEQLNAAIGGGLRQAGDRIREMLGNGITVSIGPEKPGTTDDSNSTEACIYCVPGDKTKSGKPYVGSTDDMNERQKDTSDGRDRVGAEIVDHYPKGDRDTRRRKEQQAINDRGGVENLDNKRNEIAPKKWDATGVSPPSN